MKIPFDSLTLAGVVEELQPWLGAKVQKWVQPDSYTVQAQIYRQKESWLLFSCHPQFARVHLCSRVPKRQEELLPFCVELRKHTLGARIAQIRQRRFDRILEIELVKEGLSYWLIAELMGKHANLMLTDDKERLLGAAKWLGPAKSRRPILPQGLYREPPLQQKPPVLEAQPGDEMMGFEGISPFLAKLIDAEATGLARIKQAITDRRFAPVYVPGVGAYPVSVSPLIEESRQIKRESISQALEQHFFELILTEQLERLRRSLLTQLRRMELARSLALTSVEEQLCKAEEAGWLQLQGELILAYASQLRPGDEHLTAPDYEGQPIVIVLDSDLTPIENAQRLFERAKKAKAAAIHVADQKTRLSADLELMRDVIDRTEQAQTLDELEQLQSFARQNRWLHEQVPQARRKEDRPYAGHAIKELLAPGGYRVLIAENAQANDYLTTKVAKPNDYWLHVRGAPSAHVVVQTGNHPERVQRNVIEYAARVCAANSPSKHSSYVPVDYCLKKHVRKPRGSAPGTAVYAQEKTIHVSGL